MNNDDSTFVDSIDGESIDGESIDTITIGSMGDITIPADSFMYSASWNIGDITTTAGFNGTFPSTTFTSTDPGLHVRGDADFDGDVKIKGVSIADTLEDIQKRLAILVPDPAKLAHFEALKKAYDHYKTLEALCQLPTEEHK